MWATSRRPRFCWTDWPGWNTGATIPPVLRCGPRQRWLAGLQVQGPPAGAGGSDPRRRRCWRVMLGIGHTRWATHGEPNDINAHPHVSEDGRIAMVHNGIIENYMEIKQQLLTSRALRSSLKRTPRWWLSCWNSTITSVTICWRPWAVSCGRIEGSYAFGIICADYPNALIAARKDSPLIIGCGENENFIASDVTAVISHTRDVIYMEDGEIAVLTRGRQSTFSTTRWTPWIRPTAMWTGTFPLRKRAAIPTLCSRRSSSSRRPSAKPSRPGSGTAAWCWTISRLTTEYIQGGQDRDFHRGLRLQLPCGHGQQVQLGAPAPPPGGGVSGLGIPLLRSRWWTIILWSFSSASPVRRWILWPPCGRPSGAAAGHWQW